MVLNLGVILLFLCVYLVNAICSHDFYYEILLSKHFGEEAFRERWEIYQLNGLYKSLIYSDEGLQSDLDHSTRNATLCLQKNKEYILKLTSLYRAGWGTSISDNTAIYMLYNDIPFMHIYIPYSSEQQQTIMSINFNTKFELLSLSDFTYNYLNTSELQDSNTNINTYRTSYSYIHHYDMTTTDYLILLHISLDSGLLITLNDNEAFRYELSENNGTMQSAYTNTIPYELNLNLPLIYNKIENSDILNITIQTFSSIHYDNLISSFLYIHNATETMYKFSEFFPNTCMIYLPTENDDSIIPIDSDLSCSSLFYPTSLIPVNIPYNHIYISYTFVNNDFNWINYYSILFDKDEYDTRSRFCY